MSINPITNNNRNSPVITDIKNFYGLFDNSYRDPFITGVSYIFITRPQLFLSMQPDSSNNINNMAYINMTRDSKFVPFLLEQHPGEADKSLMASISFNKSYYNNYFSSNFLPMFTNNCKNFDPVDTNVDQMDAFDTKQGFKQVLPTYKTASEASGTLTINVTEDSNLSFTKLMNIWVNYIANVTDGTFDANPEMVKNGIIDYMSSIYYFSLDADGKTIKYWAKYTGCWPSSIPYGSIRYSRGSKEALEIDLQFNYTVKEDMDPKILEEFNIISLNLANNEIPNNLINNLYASFTDSPLLVKDKMVENISIRTALNTLENNEYRDPLIFYVKSNGNSLLPDELPGHYELSFGSGSYESPVIKELLDKDDYYLNYKAEDLVSNNNSTVQYNETEYWN